MSEFQNLKKEKEKQRYERLLEKYYYCESLQGDSSGYYDLIPRDEILESDSDDDLESKNQIPHDAETKNQNTELQQTDSQQTDFQIIDSHTADVHRIMDHPIMDDPMTPLNRPHIKSSLCPISLYFAPKKRDRSVYENKYMVGVGRGPGLGLDLGQGQDLDLLLGSDFGPELRLKLRPKPRPRRPFFAHIKCRKVN